MQTPPFLILWVHPLKEQIFFFHSPGAIVFSLIFHICLWLVDFVLQCRTVGGATADANGTGEVDLSASTAAAAALAVRLCL
jgi:hypothetical protein